MTTFIFNDVDTALPVLASHLLRASKVPSRNGETRELLFPHITLTKPWRREVLNPARKASLPAQIVESMWVLAGRDDIETLLPYLPRAATFSDDGKVWRGAYGRRIRSWRKNFFQDGVDQLQFIVDLLKEDHATRRAVMSIYDPALDSKDGKDIPCNNWLHFIVRDGRLHLHVVIRSNDFVWGWSGINAFEWSVLQEVVAGLVGIEMGELHFSVSSFHMYDVHYEKASKIAEATPEWAADSPEFKCKNLEELDNLIAMWFALEEAIRKGNTLTRAEIHRDIEVFPEPMMQSWLCVIAWWWYKDDKWLTPIVGTRLYRAAFLSPRIAVVAQSEPTPEPDPFMDFVTNLHSEKHAVYGNSWKKRGEQIGIMANIARKVDRLGIAGGGDTAADTVIDLLCYLAKYRLWLTEYLGAACPDGLPNTWAQPDLTDLAEPANWILQSLPKTILHDQDQANQLLKETVAAYDELEVLVRESGEAGNLEEKVSLVDSMIPVVVVVARYLWTEEQVS